MSEVDGGYISVRDELGRVQVAEVRGLREAQGASVVWQIEYHTGPWAHAVTGRHYAFDIPDALLGRARGFDRDEAERHVAGWERAREYARQHGTGYYDGIVLNDEARETVRHLDRAVEVRQSEQRVLEALNARAMEQGFGQEL